MNVHVLLHVTTVPRFRDGHLSTCVVYMTSMQSITQSAVLERLVMEKELKKALDRCKELEQSSVPAVDGADIFYLKQAIKWQASGEGRGEPPPSPNAQLQLPPPPK